MKKNIYSYFQFVGQIPPQWDTDRLENYFKSSLKLDKGGEEEWINIEWPKKTQTQKDKKSKSKKVIH